MAKRISRISKRGGHFTGRCCSHKRPPQYNVVINGGPKRHNPKYCCVTGMLEHRALLKRQKDSLNLGEDDAH